MFYVIPEQNGSTLVCQWRQTCELQILNWLGHMDVGDEICWWQFWDLGDKFDYLLSISFESQHLKDFWFKRAPRNDRHELVQKFQTIFAPGPDRSEIFIFCIPGSVRNFCWHGSVFRTFSVCFRISWIFLVLD